MRTRRRLSRPESRHRIVAIALILGSFLASQSGVASARTLRWSSLEVDARLDADGRLHLQERHTMLFSGAWNGGERAFDVRPGQRLELIGLSRKLPETGELRPLRKGSLSLVDHYAWHDRQTLRWRSRLPGDPEFDNTALVYVIEYSLSGVLTREKENYRLDHDFAFPDRVGAIEAFHLNLELDPVWDAPVGFPETLDRGPLVPGEGVVVRADLRHRGDQTPAEVVTLKSDLQRLLPLGLALLAAMSIAWNFTNHERRQGRFLPTEAPDSIDRDWLEENLFSLRPEVAGALWDGKVGASEVSALIARWVHEGKIESNVRETTGFWKRKILELKLKTERSAFNGYESRLLNKLFFSSRRITDTEAIKKRYRSTGFSPASTIRAPIEKRLRGLPGMGRAIAGPDRTPGCILLLAFPALLGLEYWLGGESALVLLAALILSTAIPIIIASILAHRYRSQGGDVVSAGLWMAVPLAVLLLVLAGLVMTAGRWSVFEEMRLGWPGLAATAVFLVLVTNGVLNSARTRESKARVARRKQIARARKLFAEELRSDAPDLDDDWLPYLIAFGLDRRVDRWFRAFGLSSTRNTPTLSSSSSASGGSWTGGGGAFGGAGATAAWTAAAGSIAAGVSAPSSSGSGGGGSSGGGSSGGGGGGGW